MPVHRQQTHRSEAVAEARHRLLAEAAEDQRRLHRPHLRHPVGRRPRTAVSGRRCPVPHLQHLRDRRNPRDRVFAELADPVAQRAQQLAIDVHRAATHSRDHARVLRLGPVQPRQDHVPPRPQRVPQAPQDLNLHRLGPHALEDRVRHAFQPGANVIQGEKRRRLRRPTSGCACLAPKLRFRRSNQQQHHRERTPGQTPGRPFSKHHVYRLERRRSLRKAARPTEAHRNASQAAQPRAVSSSPE